MLRVSGATQDGAGSRLRPFESALPVARCVVLFSTVSLSRAAHGGVSHTTRLFAAMHRGRSDSLTERQLDRARRLRAALAAKEAARVEAINLRDTQYERRAPTYAEFYATDEQLMPPPPPRLPSARTGPGSSRKRADQVADLIGHSNKRSKVFTV